MRDDPSQISERVEDDGTHWYRGECAKCSYYSSWYKTEVLAASLLRRHRGSRDHKTATASQYRSGIL